MKDRNGGYTRVLKLGFRQGDAADVVILELVDYKLDTGAVEKKAEAKAKKVEKKTEESEDKTDSSEKATSKAKKTVAKKSASDKKTKAKINADAGKKE